MKKLLFLFLSTLLLTSCSKDDTPSESQPQKVSSATINFNGTIKTYNTFSITNNAGSDLLTISLNGNASDLFSMYIYNGTGTSVLQTLDLEYNSKSYNFINGVTTDVLNTNITTNNSEKIEGNFSGTLHDTDTNSPLTITSGTFVFYK